MPVPLRISNLKGEEWTLADLYKQIRSNAEAEWDISEELPPENLRQLEFDPTRLDTFLQFERIPIAVRAVLRAPLRLFIEDHYDFILSSVKKRLERRSNAESIPPLAKCLTFPREALGKSPAMPIQLQGNVRPDVIDPCLGLISPSTNPLADSLTGQPAPRPLSKLYYGLHDPLRPVWKKPALILVHASQDFHYPVTMKPNMERRIKKFHEENNPVVFIVHNDRFNDASYFVRPQAKDVIFYSEDGKHPFCENCPEVTFGGGYIDYCLGLAVRSYIANYFRENNTGEIQINFALDSIYTEVVTKKGEDGAKTALAEFHEIGAAEFIKRRIGQYMEGPQKLSDFDTKDRGGRLYPYLKENRFAFRIKIDGKDVESLPADSQSSNRTIVFNLITKN